MIHLLYKRWIMEQDRLDYRAGTVAAEIRNTLRASNNQKVWSASDFVANREKPKEMTTEETVAYVATLNRLLGGVDLREPVG